LQTRAIEEIPLVGNNKEAFVVAKYNPSLSVTEIKALYDAIQKATPLTVIAVPRDYDLEIDLYELVDE